MSEFILTHIGIAPYLVFALIILAGLNLPISTDVIIVLSAFIAGQLVPESYYPILTAIILGAYFSAWVSYWFGRLVGGKLIQYPFFARYFHQERLGKIQNFYQKYGFWVLLIGRFIPFGTRNGIFMSTGMSRASFTQFALRDAIACPMWAIIAFNIFYHLGVNYQLLIHYLKTFNLFIFGAFALVIINFIFYKRMKKRSNT